MSDQAVYIGDGVYIEKWEQGFRVFTHNGLHEGDKICFEPEVFDVLLRWYAATFNVTIEVRANGTSSDTGPE